jgi:type IV pilus assembly protein PilX
MNAHPMPSPRPQRGIALVTVLILLLVATLLALASMRGTLLEARMNTSAIDRSVAFQAAEAALREGEALAASKPTLPTADACENGVCRVPDPADAGDNARWSDDNWDDNSRESAVVVDGLSVRYMVELIQDKLPKQTGCIAGSIDPNSACVGTDSIYRVTARAYAPDDASGRADVTLQSTYIVP